MKDIYSVWRLGVFAAGNLNSRNELANNECMAKPKMLEIDIPEPLDTIYYNMSEKKEQPYTRYTSLAMTLQEIADELGVTKERVRQIEKRALRKLSHNILLHAHI